MKTRKTRNDTPKRCPQCEMWFTNGNKLSHHLRGTTCWGDSVPILNEETKAIWAYWKQKKFKGTPNRQFLLSATEWVQLFEDAGITSKDIGKGSQQYQLARHNDTGHYEVGNCRFITSRANTQERSEINNVNSKTKRTHTPLGTFNSLGEAATHCGLKSGTLGARIRSTNDRMKEYYYA